MEHNYRQYECLIKDSLFIKPYGDHGIQHTKRVLRLASILANYYGLSEAEWRLLAISCCYHDIGRENDLYDELHGLQSVQKMIDLGLDQKHCLSNNEFHIVKTLIIHHAIPDDRFDSYGNNRLELMYQILKDADGLDRVRFNDLDTRYLRLEKSKRMVSTAISLL